MNKQPCGAGHGIPLLPARAELLAVGRLLATAFLSPGQTQHENHNH